jgi:putative acetyltransferase
LPDLLDSDGVIEIREERPNDVQAVRDLNRRAFGQDQESNIVDALRANAAALLSLVATLNDRVVGDIMYSPAIIAGNVTGAALVPWQCFRNASVRELEVN